MSKDPTDQAITVTKNIAECKFGKFGKLAMTNPVLALKVLDVVRNTELNAEINYRKMVEAETDKLIAMGVPSDQITLFSERDGTSKDFLDLLDTLTKIINTPQIKERGE